MTIVRKMLTEEEYEKLSHSDKLSFKYRCVLAGKVYFQSLETAQDFCVFHGLSVDMVMVAKELRSIAWTPVAQNTAATQGTASQGAVSDPAGGWAASEQR